MFEGVVTEDYFPAFGTGPVMNYMAGREGRPNIFGMIQGHYVANFGKAVNTGFGEVRRQAQEKIDAHTGMVYGDWAKKHVFYHAMVRTCDAAITLSNNYAKSCREKAAVTKDPVRQAELLKMADSLEWIMDNPARTYWEGLQVIILYQLLLTADCQQHGQSMGRVDKYVGHLLENDLANGTLTMEEAQELTDAFLLRICDIMIVHGMMLNNKRVIELNENGMNAFMAIYMGMTATGGIVLTIGGSTADGEDDCNDVTRLMLQAYGRMKVPDPTVALRIHAKTPEDIWRLGIECSKLCGGMPELLNDAVVIPSMMSWGFTREDAADYSIVGCVEPGGTGNEWSASGNDGGNSIWNMMEAISLLIHGGVSPRTGKTAIKVPMLYEY
jgi:formate C-acetyltransferase